MNIIYLNVIGCCYDIILLYKSTASYDDIILLLYIYILLLNHVIQYRCVIYFIIVPEVPVVRMLICSDMVGRSPFTLRKMKIDSVLKTSDLGIVPTYRK